MKIETLKIKDFKRLASLDVNADRGIIILGGKNGAGKTSALDAIQLALCGTSSMPAQPIRDGADRAEIEVDLGEVIVKRVITRKDGGGYGGSLTIVTKDGMKPGAAQTWLNQRVGDLSCDPLAFMLSDPKKRAEQLRKLAGVDTTDLDRRRKEVEATRRDVGRDGAAEKARLDAMPYYDDAPESIVEPVAESAADILAELDAARLTQSAVEKASERHQAAHAALGRHEAAMADAGANVERMKRALEISIAERDALADGRATLLDAIDDASSAVAKAQESLVDDAPISARLAGVDERNRIARSEADAQNAKLRANEARASQAARTLALREEYAAHTQNLRAIDEERAAMLAAAKFPVPGLGFNDDGDVTFQGVPLDQASGAEKMRVSMSMALAANPSIRVVLVRDASLLDEDSMAIVADMAEAADAQVWLERVGSADPGAVVIVDGEVPQ